MTLFRRKKTLWQRALEPISERVNPGIMTRSGLKSRSEDMRLFRRRKTLWQRALEPISERVNPGNMARSGLTVAAGAVALTAASAVVSSLRHRQED
jgi:hypothetical protein